MSLNRDQHKVAHHLVRFWLLPASILLGFACNLPGYSIEQNQTSQAPLETAEAEGAGTAASPATTQTSVPSPTPALSTTPTPDYPPISDLNQVPLYWFAPLPPLPTGPGRPFTGAEDFLRLFDEEAPWGLAAERLQVFKLYGEWVAYQATDEELRLAVEGIRRRGLALAVEAGPIDPPGDCGQAVEGFAGIEEGRQIARRIQKAGGVIDLIAMDEPYYYGHFYDGPNACRWTDTRIAGEVGKFIQAMRLVFPNIIIGDTEPLAGAAGAAEYQAWLVSFKAVNGYDLDFLHMDIDWSRPTWSGEVKELEAFGVERGIPVGIIYTGNFQDNSDESWLSIAGERVKRHEQEDGGNPAHVLFQSWHDKPDFTLPEDETYTFSGFVRTYFEDKFSLGFRTEGKGANLAFQKAVRYSAALPGYTGELAVDGDPGTLWNSGQDPVQWIEIDLGAVYNIQSIRLIISQYPAGMTVHRVRARGPNPEDPYVTLHSFEGVTSEENPLFFAPEAPWQGLRYIRIETLQSPSWVAWREVEIVDAGAP
jgi:hypothetical protein